MHDCDCALALSRFEPFESRSERSLEIIACAVAAREAVYCIPAKIDVALQVKVHRTTGGVIATRSKLSDRFACSSMPPVALARFYLRSIDPLFSLFHELWQPPALRQALMAMI